MGPTYTCSSQNFFKKSMVLVGPTRAGFYSYSGAADSTRRDFTGTLYLCCRGKDFELSRWLRLSRVANEFVTTNSVVFLSGLFDPISLLAYHV